MAKVALVENTEDTGASDLAPVQRRGADAASAPVAEKPAAERAPSVTTEAPGAAQTPPPAPKKGGRRRLILAGVALIAIAAGAYWGHGWWTTGRFMVSTDDAYIGVDSAVIAPRLAGYVTRVAAIANTEVKAGDPLVYLDDSDQRLAVTTAENQIAAQEATLSRIDRQIDAARAGIAQADAAITSAKADSEMATADLDRASKLAASQFASKQSLEQARATSDKSAAAVDSATAGLATAKANIEVLTAERVEAERALDQFRTSLEQKKLDLERTVIRAPFDGVVGNRAVDPGEYVATGQRLLALIPLADVYIDANFKETQLGQIHPGARATITVDADAEAPIEGTVESVAPASGSVFSLLPPDNATGNFTKITQRVPVRIKVPASAIARGSLRPGLSVTVEIDSRTGGNAQASL